MLMIVHNWLSVHQAIEVSRLHELLSAIVAVSEASCIDDALRIEGNIGVWRALDTLL
jgi:hypothetical protein